jgi:hypothetical protein
MVSVGQRQSLIEAAACAHCRPRAHKHTRKYTSKHLCKRAVALATMNYRARVHQLERDVITRRHPAAASPTDGHRRMATAVCQGRGRVACQPMHMLWWNALTLQVSSSAAEADCDPTLPPVGTAAHRTRIEAE